MYLKAHIPISRGYPSKELGTVFFSIAFSQNQRLDPTALIKKNNKTANDNFT